MGERPGMGKRGLETERVGNTGGILGGCEIVGISGAIRGILSVIHRIADSDSNVIIYGGTGTGKDLIARAIHCYSRRSAMPFVTINCGAIPETLLESELFGHVKGAFTGALGKKEGKFALANQGTIFLDEIGDMSWALQVKLLRVLETRSFEPLGGSRTVSVDVRIIAATHRDLKKAIREGTFREDLFYRLHVIPLRIPPLRDRREDIPLLLSHFIEHFNKARGMNIAGITKAASECLSSYGWPGNVRELRNTVERLVVRKGQGQIDVGDLPPRLRLENPSTPSFAGGLVLDGGIALSTAVQQFEKKLILQSLERTCWVKNRAAELLHLKRTTLVEKIKRHGINRP